MKQKIKAFLLRLWVLIIGSDLSHTRLSPFNYITKETGDLRVGDYLVAYNGYIQYISAEDTYTGERTITVRNGKAEPITFVGGEFDEWAVRVHNPDFRVE